MDAILFLVTVVTICAYAGHQAQKARDAARRPIPAYARNVFTKGGR